MKKISNKEVLTIVSLKYFGYTLTTISKLIFSGLQFDEILNILGLKDEILNKTKQKAFEIINYCNDNNIQILTYFDDEFPEELRYIKNPPLVLYFKGNKALIFNKNKIAVVGTRNPISISIHRTSLICEYLIKKGYIIVSGLALGCDTIAHEATIKFNGKTIAVLPCSIDKIFPDKNYKLAQKILNNNGLIISEYAPFEKLERYHFIQRDRIQSALSQSVIVVQSSIKGGTMHTAKFCIEQNRILCVLKVVENNEQFSGNDLLLKKNNTIEIKNLSDIDELLDSLDLNLSIIQNNYN